MDLTMICIRLRANAAAIAALVDGVSPHQATWKPAEDKWSILEVVNHLADEEVEDFRKRLGLTLSDPAQPWPPVDPESWVHSRNYAGRDLHESMRRFLQERQSSLNWLRTLSSPDWDRTHHHATDGPFRAGDLLASWLEHDFLHLRQLLRLHHEYHLARTPEYEVRYAGEW